MPRKPLYTPVLLLFALLVAACGGAPSGGTAATAQSDAAASPASTATGGTLTIGRSASPDSLNPGSAYIIESGQILSLVYDTLIRVDLKSQTYPGLATEWSVAEDGRTWTFKLAKGATWHDGTPVTAEDVKFTFEMIKSFDSFATLKDYTSLLESVAAPDPSTAVITFEQPVANADERFSQIYILPKHIWEQFPDEASALEFENTEMIGSGPFRLAEYRPGEFTRLTAVKDHYATPPKIDELIFRVFGNGDAEVQALRTGEVDLISAPSRTVVRSLQADPKIKVEIGNQYLLADIFFNVVTPENCPPEVGKCTGHPALRDVRVRQALAHATDKQALIDGILLGMGRPGLSLVTPAQGEAFASHIQDYAFDVAKANQILDEAGYVDTNGDGVREMPGDPSKPLSFRYSYPSDQDISDGPRIFELLRDQWRQAGIEITLTPLEAEALAAACCPAFDFDVVSWGWSAESDPASLLYIATTEQIPTGVSEAGYSNPEYDRLFAEQQITMDKAKRRDLIYKMQEILLRDVPYIVTYYAQAVSAYRADRFQGWVVEPDGVLELSNRLSLVNVTPVP
ncbi:MAG: peptide ABC transporter substrate-binding protein [Chloroflexales bacterium]|nr:peptide ABC transporter substrate-binding protein [Chloroflexales bacterium]